MTENKAANLLHDTLEAWGPAWVHDREVNGGDLVEWFFGTFMPELVIALEIPHPTKADWPDDGDDPDPGDMDGDHASALSSVFGPDDER